MTKEQLAAKLNGRQHYQEITDDEELDAKGAGLVVVFGDSDDLCQFRGAIHDEYGCYGGATICLNPDGTFVSEVESDDEEVLRRHGLLEEAKQRVVNAAKIYAALDDNYSWTYRTDIPHATFDILDGDEKYCRGIVFHMADLAK